MKTRSHSVVPLFAFVLLLAFGAGGASAHPQFADRAQAKDIASLTWAVPATIRGLDYTHSADAVTASVISLGMETLVQYDRLGRLRPNLASSFSTPNATTYVYVLRKGVKFWDGHPLTTADVVYSLQQSASKAAGSNIASFFSDVTSMAATGPRTVTIKLKGANPFFRYSIAVTPIGEKAFWSAHLKDLGTPGVLNMGTGPFKFTKFVPDDSVTMTRNNAYWGRKAAAKKITLKFIVDAATRQLAVRSHQVDGTFQVPQEQIDQYKKLSGVKVQVAPELRTAYISLDVATPPFNDVHVRRALAYALDKAGLVKAVLRGYGQPAPTMPPPEQWGDLMSQKKVKALYKSLPQYAFSMAKAKAELAKSAFPNGFTATAPYPDSRQELGKALLSLAQNVKTIGITLNVKQVTTDEWFNTLYTHPTPLGMQTISWGVDYPDPADALALIYPSAYATANAFNTSNYKSAAMDALIDKQNASVSPAVRAKAISSALKLAATDVPYIPVWYQQIAMALNSKYQFKSFGTWYLYSPWARDITPA
ncbi:MAG: peptide/nickel transport system substrate-binding protein [Gaiellaceae bacterium]|nr:peptide/nickel transport system substrate-binding protein [Gaiellaceae bacterium]